MAQSIMSQSAKLGLVAVLAVAAFSQAVPSAWAFSTENLNVNQSGSARYSDPDDAVKNGQATPSASAGNPFMHFGAGAQPFNRQGSNSNYPPPQPYAMPLGNGN